MRTGLPRALDGTALLLTDAAIAGTGLLFFFGAGGGATTLDVELSCGLRATKSKAT
jgi:hypothetical protein